MQKFKPKVDKLFFIIAIPTVILLAACTFIAAFDLVALLIMIPADLATVYFLVSPIFGYVELRESTLFIKYGFILKREIPYNKIRGIEKKRKFYCESMMSLKNSFEHIDIKYNSFDVTSISVSENDKFIKELNERL